MIDIAKFIADNAELDMVFDHYFKHCFYYTCIVGADTYMLCCGDTDGDIYRDGWNQVERVGDLIGEREDVHYIELKGGVA